MLLTHEKFASFATKPLTDSKSQVAALFSLSMESMAKVNDVVERGLQAGGKEVGELKDYGFMQQRTVEDFDGYTWEIFYMDMSKMPQ